MKKQWEFDYLKIFWCDRCEKLVFETHSCFSLNLDNVFDYTHR